MIEIDHISMTVPWRAQMATKKMIEFDHISMTVPWRAQIAKKMIQIDQTSDGQKNDRNRSSLYDRSVATSDRQKIIEIDQISLTFRGELG